MNSKLIDELKKLSDCFVSDTNRGTINKAIEEIQRLNSALESAQNTVIYPEEVVYSDGLTVLRTDWMLGWNNHTEVVRASISEALKNKCPKCGDKLEESNITRDSLPPQVDVWCDGCGYKGYKEI